MLPISRLGLAMLGCLFLFAASEVPARADLRVCNQSANPVWVALGYSSEKGWQSEGWWNPSPSKCATVFRGPLHTRFFYIYVADGLAGGSWEGDNFMCTRDQSFTIFGIEDCVARGYDRTGFLELDTHNQADWTLKLVDPAPSPQDASAPPADAALGPDDTQGNVPALDQGQSNSGDANQGDTVGMD